MEQLKTRKFAGIDLGEEACALSIYDEGSGEMEEERFPLPSGEPDYIRTGLDMVMKYFESNQLGWDDFQEVRFAMKDPTPDKRELLDQCLGQDFHNLHQTGVITRFRAFVEYFFHQERAVWDRNALLLDFSEGRLSGIFVEQIRRARQKAYRAVQSRIDTGDIKLNRDNPELDIQFCKLVKQFLVRHPAYIIYLTGDGFEGDWMKKTLNYLCAGRRVFLGQNLFANGACLLGIGPVPLMEEGMILMQGDYMVRHTIGVISQEAGRTRYVPIASIGKEWFNTGGSIDIIMDRSQKVDFFYHNSMENEMECASCEIKDIPRRPAKTTRLHIKVDFTSETSGVILITDMGFGTMFPATGKVTVFPFRLIS